MTGLYADLRDAPGALPVPERAMTIGAHPDDAEFGAGAVLARWAEHGCEVTMVVVTDGSKGTWDADADPAALVAVRRDEQRRAAEVLGAARVVHLDRVDGELEYSMALRAELCALVRRHRPDVVLTHDPWQRYQLHPDHRVTGLVALDGVVAARDPLFFPDQGLAPHRPGGILLWSADEPDHAETAPAWAVDRKVQALLQHASQRETTMGGAGEQAAARFRERIEQWLVDSGARLGAGPAEIFKRLTP